MSKADLLCEKAVKPIPLTYSILLHIFRSIKFCKVYASLCKKCVKWWVRIPSRFQSYIEISLYKKVLNIFLFLDIKGQFMEFEYITNIISKSNQESNNQFPKYLFRQ